MDPPLWLDMNNVARGFIMYLATLDVRLIVGDAIRKRETGRKHRRVETKNI